VFTRFGSPRLSSLPKVDKKIAGKRFQSNEKVNDAVNTSFKDLEEKQFREGIEKLEKLWTKC
jgi:hypothetical protein